MKLNSLKFELKDVVQILSVAVMLITQYYSLKSDIKELILYRKEDEKFLNLRISRIESDVQKHSNAILDLQLRNRNAILPETPKITSDGKSN
jgi:hypothetical protein